MPDKRPQPGKDSPDGVWSQDTHIGAPRSLPGLNAGDGITLESAGKKALPEGQQVSDEAADRRSIKELLDKGSPAQERYVVDREIARGGMGAILRAVDGDIRREVALKVMLSQDAAKRPRFIEEAQITGQLEHPNIVPVHELSVDAQGRVFFTMKLVRGRSLEDVLKQMRKQPQSGGSKYSLVRLLNVLVNVCHAVAFAHSKGVIHRDLKPSNVMLGDYGEVLVMDWGLAKVLGRPEEAEPRKADRGSSLPEAVTESGQVRTSRQESGTDATLDGSVIGTPVYMPPEQAEGRVGEVDERSDVYALGAILYEILTLQPPVETRGGALVVIGRVSRGEVIAPERRAPDRAAEGKIPKELSAIAMKALSLKMEDRYGSAEEFRRDIELYLEGRAVSAKEDTFAESVVKLVKRNKTASVVAAAAAAIIAAIVGTAFWLNLQEKRAAVAAQARAEDALAERDKEQARRQAEESARRAERGKSAPAFLNAARLSADQKRFDDALAQVAVALEYAPDFAEARLFKAQLHIVQDEYPAAVAELDRYLKDRPDDKDAAELRELSARAVTEKNLDPRFAAVFERQKAWAFSEQKVRTLDRLLPLCNKRVQESWPGVSLKLNNEGSATLDWGQFHKESVRDLSPLAGMPVSVLDLNGTNVTDLSPLRGMPMARLILGNCAQIRDLSPLQSMPLTSLDLGRCNGIQDLSPLKGMPLTWLSLNGCRQIKDLTLLKGMPLTCLDLRDCGRISDLTPLAGMLLTCLYVAGNGQVRDLTPLTGMPLTDLVLANTSIADLTPLEDMPLIWLNLAGCGQVSDLTPLKGLKLSKLVFSPKTVRQGMEVIRNMKSLSGIGTGEAHLWPPAEFWKKYDAGEFSK